MARSETQQAAIIGVERCGCVTYANARPERMSNKDKRELMEMVVEQGLNVVHTTVAAARRRKHFLPSQCPHDPKGWQFDPASSEEERVETASGGTNE